MQHGVGDGGWEPIRQTGGAQHVTIMGGAPLAAATITNIPTGTADAQGVAAQSGLRLLGFSINESAVTAAAASLILRHGAAATDPEIMDLTLAADGQTDRWFGPDGISIPNGLFVDRVSGETKLTLYTKVA